MDYKSENVWLMQGDCLERMKEIPDGSVDLLVTDPPYKVTSRGGYTSAGGMMLDKEMRKGRVFKHNQVGINEWLKEVVRVLKDKSHVYIMTNNKNIREFMNKIHDSGLHVVKCLIWVKDNKIMSQAYMSQFEYVIFARKGGFKRINDCGTSDVIFAKNVKGKTHPTEKPEGLLQVLIENSSKEGDTVLDLFMGTGSCGSVCKNLDRKFIGIEIDEGYFDIACNRIEDAQRQESMF